MSLRGTYNQYGWTLHLFGCDNCGDDLPESYPRWSIDGKDYCCDCSFKLGMISEVEYCDKRGGIDSSMSAAGINPVTGEIEVVSGKSKRKLVGHHYKSIRISRSKFSWEKTDKEYRHTKQYSDWRSNVFIRDNYTCMDCNVRGGYLEAHHIKPFKSNKSLRYSVDNGITLCLKCHHLKHLKRGK